MNANLSKVTAGSVSKSFYLAELACWALEQEARLSPKPGLVDSRGSGVHSDMNLSMLLASARSLKPFFSQMANAACIQSTGYELRQELGHIGRQAETAMLEVTNGVNTHRGAIWALGLLVAAAVTSDSSLFALLQRAGYLACYPDDRAPVTTQKSHGQQVCEKYQLPGAREQAQQGFPHLHQLGLPVLHQSRATGEPEFIARLNALLAIMSSLPDTCVLSRAGLNGLEVMQQGAQAVLDAGGSGSLDGRQALKILEQQLLALQASAGGAADLLAATLFVDSLLEHNLQHPDNKRN